MNERIKQLAEQAYNWTREEAKEGNNQCRIGSDYFLMMEKEKFAELIVKECLIQVVDVRLENDFEPVGDAVLVQALTSIREHFGVK